MKPEIQAVINWANDLELLLTKSLDTIPADGRLTVIRIIHERYKAVEKLEKGTEQFIALCAMSGLATALKRWERQNG